MSKLTEILARAIHYGEKVPADIRMRSIGLPTQPPQDEFIEQLEQAINAYIAEREAKLLDEIDELWCNDENVFIDLVRMRKAEQRKRAGL